MKIFEPYLSKKFIKAFLITFLIVFVSLTSFYFNVKLSQEVESTPTLEENKIEKKSSKEILLDAATTIIVREGRLNLATARQYAHWIYEAGNLHGVDPVLILSVMTIESRFDYKAISPTGPIGLLQVAYSWHKEKTTKKALFDPKNNINVGAQILKEYSDRSKTETETLLRYNGSFGKSKVYAMKVLSVKKKYKAEIDASI